MGVGRIVCVVIPFVLTLAALVVFLVASFGPIKLDSIYLLQVDLTNFSLDPATIAKLISSVTPRQVASTNLTAGDFGLQPLYRVNLWGYCWGDSTASLVCTGPTFDWASHVLNTTFLTTIGAATGHPITLPTAVNDDLTAFTASIKWAEVLDVVAIGLLVIDFLLSFFTGFSRVASCATYIVAGLATSAVAGTAILSTVIVAAALSVLSTTAEPYGVVLGINPTFLIMMWAAVALCMVASLFWCLSICGCAPSHHSRRQRPASNNVAFRQSSSYQPLVGQEQTAAFVPPVYHSGVQPGVRYEPYSYVA